MFPPASDHALGPHFQRLFHKMGVGRLTSFGVHLLYTCTVRAQFWALRGCMDSVTLTLQVLAAWRSRVGTRKAVGLGGAIQKGVSTERWGISLLGNGRCLFMDEMTFSRA